MKHRWLFIALIVLIAIWAQRMYVSVLLLLLATFFHYRRFHDHHLIFVSVLCVLFIFFNSKSEVLEPSTNIVQVKEIKGKYIVAKQGKQDVLLYNVQNANYGDVLEVVGKFEKVESIHNMQAFHFASWLARRDIFFQIQAKSFSVKQEGEGLRHDLYERVTQRDDPGLVTWLKQTLYGMQESEGELSYFVSASGLHISFLLALVKKTLRLKFTDRTVNIVAFVLLGSLAYCFVLTSSLLRLLCFQSITIAFPKMNTKDKLGSSILFLLLLAPYMAFEMAFVLPVAFRLVGIFQFTTIKKIMVSYIILIPIQFYYMHSCDILQITLFKFLRMLYALNYVLALICVGIPALSFLSVPSRAFLNILQVIANLKLTLYYTPSFLWLCAWMVVVCRMLSVARKINLVYFVLLLVYSQYGGYLNPFGEVLMIDVGQGDSTLIVLPFQQGTILIDVAGNRMKNIPADILVPILRGKGIRHIDKVIITHDDFDHSGGLAQLQELMPVNEVITKKTQEALLDGFPIRILAPQWKGEDKNEDSLVVYLEMFAVHFLFMGDAGYAAEKQLLSEYPKLAVDVIKLGHHGSKTSSSLPFIHQLQPKLSLISCGRNNFYGHPHAETMDILQKEQVYSLTTSKSGDISIKSSKFFTFFKTAENEFGIMDGR